MVAIRGGVTSPQRPTSSYTQPTPPGSRIEPSSWIPKTNTRYRKCSQVSGVTTALSVNVLMFFFYLHALVSLHDRCFHRPWCCHTLVFCLIVSQHTLASPTYLVFPYKLFSPYIIMFAHTMISSYTLVSLMFL